MEEKDNVEEAFQVLGEYFKDSRIIWSELDWIRDDLASRFPDVKWIPIENGDPFAFWGRVMFTVMLYYSNKEYYI